MEYELFVEISAEMSPEVRRRLAISAYRASRWGTVALVLRGVEPDAVDRWLDSAVRKEGVGVSGVRYLDPEVVAPRIRNGSGGCTVVTADPASWMRDAGGRVGRLLDPAQGLGRLESDPAELMNGR